MSKMYQGYCKQCHVFYIGRGRYFCDNSCRVRWTNLNRNVAKREDVRAKISASRKGKPTSLGIPCPENKKLKISDALKGRPTGRRPSDKAIKAWSEAGRRNLRHGSGINHPNWKGGLTPQRIMEYRTPEYLSFVKTVLTRDNYTCQICGIHNGLGERITLQVHHKIPYAELNKEDRYNPEFGITLCWKCHNLTKQHRIKKSNDFQPRIRICQNCGKEYKIWNPRKYCPECRAMICCPVCGSTKCSHTARKTLNQPSLF